MVSDEEGPLSRWRLRAVSGSACAVWVSEAHAEESRRLLRADRV